MGDIPNKGLGQFELNTTERLKVSLLEDLKNNKENLEKAEKMSSDSKK